MLHRWILLWEEPKRGACNRLAAAGASAACLPAAKMEAAACAKATQGHGLDLPLACRAADASDDSSWLRVDTTLVCLGGQDRKMRLGIFICQAARGSQEAMSLLSRTSERLSTLVVTWTTFRGGNESGLRTNNKHGSMTLDKQRVRNAWAFKVNKAFSRRQLQARTLEAVLGSE